MIRFKVCCILNQAEVNLAVRYGASAVGLVSAMPSGPGVIAEDTIRELAHAVPPGVDSFLLTSLRDTPAIIEQQRRLGASTIQLVDSLATGTHADLRAALPGVKIVQVVHVTGEESIDEVRALGDSVHAILLDSGRPDLAVKELGGTGRVHNWEISRAIVEAARVPVYLAGGLSPDNVGAAIAAVRPFGVDVCSGLRTGAAKELDERKLATFAEIVHAASL
ncbi:MAG: phosphoribosylanthranilate isomerase [Gemmatimonadetes bacterium]|nr:phosphoribosylanthranilate isomerase [Gemmatimonadota bacterium]